MSAIVPAHGPTRQLDRQPEPDEQITEEQVQEPARLVIVLMGLLRDVATMKRRWWPRRMDFEDVAVDATGTTQYRLHHGFGGRVRWWLVDWSDAAFVPALQRDATASDDNTLVLVSSAAGVATIRIEEAG